MIPREVLRVGIRGGGDLASGAILRLHRAGWAVLVAELPQPLAVRRTVSFSQAVYDGATRVEEVWAERIEDAAQADAVFAARRIPVMVDPQAHFLTIFRPDVLVDARMRKQPPEPGLPEVGLFIGLGPGFTVGVDCDAVIETKRGPRLGRVYWQGSAETDTGQPEAVQNFRGERVLRAPAPGVLTAMAQIGDWVREGQPVVGVASRPVLAPFDGLVRGLLQDGLSVEAGQKIGDIDPRDDPTLWQFVSDKALAVGGGVLEAILSWRARDD